MGDWKNDKAEAEMREADKKMMKKAGDKKKAEEDAAWQKVENTLT